jgi:hypothetical protein
MGMGGKINICIKLGFRRKQEKEWRSIIELTG